MESKTYSFSNFTRALVEDSFQLEITKQSKLMEGWIQNSLSCEIQSLDEQILLAIHKNLVDLVSSWNEQELQMQFISPVLMLVNFIDVKRKIGAFAERELKQKIKDKVIHGKVDWMVASGRYEPTQPFFFIHKYKKGLGGSGDPIGQLLITMYVAQLLNQEPVKPTLFEPEPVSYIDLPIYGCYVVGRHWYFVVLKDKDYYISKSYDATDEEKLYEIVKLLKAQKQMIIERVTQNQ